MHDFHVEREKRKSEGKKKSAKNRYSECRFHTATRIAIGVVDPLTLFPK